MSYLMSKVTFTVPYSAVGIATVSVAIFLLLKLLRMTVAAELDQPWYGTFRAFVAAVCLKAMKKSNSQNLKSVPEVTLCAE